MASHHLLYVTLVATSALVSAGIGVIAWRNRSIVGSSPLAGLMLAVTVWSLAKLLALASSGPSSTDFWVNAQYVGIVFVPAMWLIFALEYTARGERLTERVLAALAVEPALALSVLWTNDVHGLFRTSTRLVTLGPFTGLASTPGPLFWLHVAYSYLLLAGGTWLLVQMVLLSDHQFRGQSLGLLTSALVPWIGNALYVLDLVPPVFDVTIIAFTVSGVVLFWAISRHQLLELVPLARELARDDFMDTMSDAIVVIDERNRLVDCNPAAERILDAEAPDVIGRPLERVYPPLAEAIDSVSAGDAEISRTELEFWDNNEFRSYDVRVSALRRGHGLLTGRLISLRDVTEQRQREQQLDVLNRMLRHNLRNELNVVRGNATMLKGALTDAGLEQRVETIEASVDQMITRVDKVKKVANTSDLGTHAPVNIVDELDDLVAAKRRKYPDARITMDCPDRAWVAAGPAVSTALDEVITNALKHHDDDTPTVDITVTVGQWNDQESVRIRVTDTGPGIPEREIDPIIEGKETPLDHSTGVGLWLVMWTVREVGGDVDFSETDDGTTVVIHLPRGTESEKRSLDNGNARAET